MATLLATIIGAVVAAAIGLYVARSERPQPFFRAEARWPQGSDWSVNDGVVSIEVVLLNVGDGPAFDLEVVGKGGVPRGGRKSVPKLEPGASVSTYIRVVGSGSEDYNMRTGEHTDDRVITWPAGAAAAISWQQPPQRGNVRRLTLALENPDMRTNA